MSEIKLACEVAEQVKAICDKHGNLPGELINILHEAQHLQGYLPEEMQRLIAHKLNIPVSKVYGVVTFYTFFTMTPKGKYPISVCMGTACYVRGSEKLLEEFIQFEADAQCPAEVERHVRIMDNVLRYLVVRKDA